MTVRKLAVVLLAVALAAWWLYSYGLVNHGKTWPFEAFGALGWTAMAAAAASCVLSWWRGSGVLRASTTLVVLVLVVSWLGTWFGPVQRASGYVAQLFYGWWLT